MTTPPLLMLAKGRKPRPRKPATEKPKEIELHMDVAHLLRKRARADWRWTHIPSGELRDVRVAMKLKRMSTQRGWPDFILVSPAGKLHALELKRPGGRLSEAQGAFQVWACAWGLPHCVAESMKDVLAILDYWGALAPVNEVRS